MSVEKYFTDMYRAIWQSEDISRIDEFYAKDFEELIETTGSDKQPIQISLGYQGIVDQAKFQKDNYRDTTFEARKIVAGEGNTISVHFYSTSIDIRTNELRHRCVCGIWRLNAENKIDRVWAVVTPFYPE